MRGGAPARVQLPREAAAYHPEVQAGLRTSLSAEHCCCKRCALPPTSPATAAHLGTLGSGSGWMQTSLRGVFCSSARGQAGSVPLAQPPASAGQSSLGCSKAGTAPHSSGLPPSSLWKQPGRGARGWHEVGESGSPAKPFC